MSRKKINIHWFRRDLRLADNAGLYHALKGGYPVLGVFVFDTEILSRLQHKNDARVTFIYDTVKALKDELQTLNGSLYTDYNNPINTFEKLFAEFDVQGIYTNTDYEAYGIKRDAEVKHLAEQHGAQFFSYKDQVILDATEVTKDNREPYTVFTPFSKKWRSVLTNFHLTAYPTEKYFKTFLPCESNAVPSLAEMNFERAAISFPERVVHADIVKAYAAQRDIPGITGTTHLGLHLRFGTLSIRALAGFSAALSNVFLSELIWRDFYQMILAHFPRLNNGASFKPAYDRIQWRNDENEFAKWCAGETGYPIVDAGMRELSATGFMHNRVRMITASFLCKHLLIDWRWGEAYFADHLLDYDFAANNGGWQWASGSGCDSAPYFRIFNPYLQTKRFDADHRYIRKWVPEFKEPEYPQPIVDHAFARERCLRVYKEGLRAL